MTAQEVEATPLGGDLAEITGLDVMVASIVGRAAEAAGSHVPHTIEGAADFKASKRARASARKERAALRAEYEGMVGPVREALADADARVAEALGPLDAVDEAYKAAIDDWGDHLRFVRLADLTQTYSEYAPDLMELVPLELLAERYGSVPGSKWLLQSTNVERARRLLCDAIDEVARDEQRLEAMVEPEDVEAAKARYFATLDLGAALEEAQGRKEGRERVRGLEEAREGRNAVAEHFAAVANQPEAGQVPPYVMCCYGSRADADSFALWCEGRGVKATIRPTHGATFRITRA